MLCDILRLYPTKTRYDIVQSRDCSIESRRYRLIPYEFTVIDRRNTVLYETHCDWHDKIQVIDAIQSRKTERERNLFIGIGEKTINERKKERQISLSISISDTINKRRKERRRTKQQKE